MKKYDKEVKARWGNSDAYKEYKNKTSHYSKDKWQQINEGLNAIFFKFSECMKAGHQPDSAESQELVKELQTYITENYYSCNSEILAGLGQMYVSDERFKNNIDKNAPGTAEFVLESINIYSH